MKNTARTWSGARVAAMLLAAQLAACAASVGNGDGGADAPSGTSIVGTWRVVQMTPEGTVPPGVQTTTTLVTFAADMTVQVAISFAYATSAPSLAGCTETVRQSGQRWSTAGDGGAMQLHITGEATVTDERSGCTNPTDNEAPSSVMASPTTDVTLDYSLNGNTLTWTQTNPPSSATLVRQ